MLRKLKRRWEIESNAQLMLIILAFSITGSCSLWVKKLIFHWLGVDSSFSLGLIVLLSILIITPVYQVLLIAIGSALGQFRFFWAFEKKMLARIIPGFTSKTQKQ